MSLGIVVKGPEGLVLAADSRVTLLANAADAKIPVNFDNATKLLSFSAPNTAVGVVTYGQAVIGNRTAHSFVPEFEADLGDGGRLPVDEFARKLSAFYMKQWSTAMPANYRDAPMTFVVGGFDEGGAYGRMFLSELPHHPEPKELHAKPGEFGITWGGQREIVDRLIKGYDVRLPETIARALSLGDAQVQVLMRALDAVELPIPLPVMALQDCVDLAIFFIRTTISAQTLTIGIRGCGGFIDVATITRSEGIKFVQRKQIRGEDQLWSQ